jgi:hypothetical protein
MDLKHAPKIVPALLTPHGGVVELRVMTLGVVVNILGEKDIV